jgi:hypothetical protein
MLLVQVIKRTQAFRYSIKEVCADYVEGIINSNQSYWGRDMNDGYVLCILSDSHRLHQYITLVVFILSTTGSINLHIMQGYTSFLVCKFMLLIAAN